MKIAYFISATMLGIVCGVILAYSNSANDIYHALPFLVEGLLIAAVIERCRELLSDSKQRDSRKRDMERAIECMEEMRTKGSSIAGALDSILGLVYDISVIGDLRKELTRRKLGKTISAPYLNKQNLESVENRIKESASNAAISTAKTLHTLQNVSTLNMFIASIIPSFIVFGFVSETVLVGGTFNYGAFAEALVIFVPLAYLFPKFYLSRKLLEI